MDNNNLMNNNTNNNIIEKTEKKNFLDIFVEIIGKITLLALFLFIIDYAYSLMFANKPLIVLKQENNKYSSLLYDMYICENGKTIKFKNEKFSCEEIDGIDIDNNKQTSENTNTENNNKENNNTTIDKNKTNENTKNNNSAQKEIETKKDDNTINNDNKSNINKDISNDKLVNEESKNENSNNKIIIEDRQKGDCAQALDYYYKDNEYEYYFTCKKSNNVYIIKDGKEYTIRYALNNNIVTMQELIDNGFNPLKKSRNLVDK